MSESKPKLLEHIEADNSSATTLDEMQTSEPTVDSKIASTTEGTESTEFYGSKLNSWFPEMATSWVNTAKEKTKSTLETMKKDINEFSDSIQQGANTLAHATVEKAHLIQQMIVPTPDIDVVVKKAEELSTEGQGEPQKHVSMVDGEQQDQKGGANFFGIEWMKQMVETVQKFATEDTTVGEAECTEEIRVGEPNGRKTILDRCTLLQLQNDPRTFLHPPAQSNLDYYKDWLADHFKIAEYNGEINILLGQNPRLRELYSELVPSQVDNFTFWNRYFFKVHLKELEKDKRSTLDETKQPQINIGTLASPAGAGDAHSPAPSNGGKDDWSMCSSGAATEVEDCGDRGEATTPRPPVGTGEEEVDDWEECGGETGPANEK